MTAMKRNFLIIGLWALLAGVAAVSQEAEQPAEPEANPEAAEAGADPSKSSEPAASDDVFVPSERISADQEITFPVDI